MHIKYDWDATKRQRTLTERGIDFADMARFDWDTALVIEDTRQDYGEPRWRALGTIDTRLHAVVFTLRDDTCRVISLRKANEREQRLWERS